MNLGCRTSLQPVTFEVEGRVVAWKKTRLNKERLWPEGSEGEQGTDLQARKPPESQG